MITNPCTAEPSRRQHPRRLRGFTFIEVGLVLLIAVFAAMIAGSTIGKIRHRARCDLFAQDLRIFSAAFQSYRQRHGTWPAASNGTTAIPPGMERFLQGTNWLHSTPLGGNYRWVAPYPAGSSGDKSPPTAAIALTAFPSDAPLHVSSPDLLDIDGKIDDGNLATGKFRSGFNGWPVYLVKF